MDAVSNSLSMSAAAAAAAAGNNSDSRSGGPATVVTFVAMVLGVMSNIIFLAIILTCTGRKSRLRLFLFHLAMANLFVCCFTIALELGWRVTVYWLAGDVMCRILSLTKTLGLYAESYIIVALAADHYYTVMWPMGARTQTQRAKMLLIMAWSSATVFSVPQAIVFHEEQQDGSRLKQCVTINSFLTENAENAYVTFGLLAMYGVPLVAILLINCLLFIRIQSWQVKSAKTPVIKISHEDRTPSRNSYMYSDVGSDTSSLQVPDEGWLDRDSPSCGDPPSQMRVRCHTGFQIRHTEAFVQQQARRRAVKLSLLMMVTFLVACSPYAGAISTIATSEVHRDPNAPEDEISRNFNEGLLIFTLCLGTLVNPLFYGFYICYDRRQWRATESRLPKNWEQQGNVKDGQRLSVPAPAMGEKKLSYISVADGSDVL